MGLSRDQTENSGNKEPVKFGYEAISNTGKCGMPENHMKAMMLSAQESESIIMIRPVSPAAAEFISGGASTKDFDIKTKSTKEVSPFVGLLVVDPNFSGTIKVITEKLDGKQENSHDKYTAGVKDAFNKNKKHTPKDEEPSLIEMPATISKERMENLMAQVNSKGQKLFSVVEDYQNGEDPEIKKITWEKDVIERKETEKDKFTETITKTQITAYAKPDVNNPSMMAFFSDEQCTKPITVLGKNIINKENNKEQRPVTADYDLFAVVPKWKSVNQEISGDSKAEWAGDMKAPDVTVGQSNMESLRKAPIDKRPFRTQGDYTANQREVQNTAVRNEKLEASLKAKEERVNTNKIKEINPSLSPPSPAPKEDDLQGNVSLRVQSTINIINKNIQIQDKNRQGTQGLNMVHHNDEGHNPFADSLKDNLPILIFLPPDPKIKLNLQEGKENQPMLVQSVEDLKYIREKLQEAGYYWSTHGRFKKELPAFREEVIGEIKKEIEDKWKSAPTSTNAIFAVLGTPKDEFKLENYRAKVIKDLENLLKHENDKLKKIKPGQEEKAKKAYVFDRVMLLTKFISEINGKTAPEAKAAISGKTNAEAILKVLEDLKTKLMENPKNTEEATIIKDLKVLMKQVNKIVEVEKAGQEIIAKAEPPLKEPTKKVAPVEKAAVQEVNSTPGRRL